MARAFDVTQVVRPSGGGHQKTGREESEQTYARHRPSVGSGTRRALPSILRPAKHRVKRAQRPGIPKKTPVRETGCFGRGERDGRTPVLRISAWLGVAQAFQDFGGVALGLDRRPDRRNFASFADKDRKSVV